MKRLSAKLAVTLLGVAIVGSAITVVRAQSAPLTPAPPAVSAPVSTAPGAIDPALQKMLLALATAVVANFAASASTGSLDDFDPARTVEPMIRSALNSRELNTALDRVVDQVGSSADGAASSMSPEVQALLKLALKSVVTVARNELAREFAPVPVAAPAVAPLAAPWAGQASSSSSAP